MLQTLSTENHIIKAIDTIQTDGRTQELQSPHTTTRKDTALVPELKLAVGARAMLIANVDVSDGLCNGVSGIIKGIEFADSPNMPNVVFLQFDSTRIGSKSRATQCIPAQYSACVAIKPYKKHN